MKTKTLIFAALIISFSANSQDWVEFCPSETIAPTYNQLSSTDTIVEFEVLIPGMYATEVDSFQRVNIPEYVKFDSTGCPEIPVVSFLVAVPECGYVNNIS
ncbi:MAG: hypothetical protein H8D45_10360 [Bacteroidetes bacterium]|nr:hypothetical protein [Bacteroidota bacterium]MBL7104616.1 hypothetical protein [Bacteroidales bacterium]